MIYAAIRSKFIELSGRYDLVNSDKSDNGADFFFDAGQKYLDMMQDTKKMQATSIQSVAAGTTIVKTIGLRSIIEVKAGNTTSGLIRLEKVSLSEMKAYYEEQLSSVDQGPPAYYAPTSLRPYPDTVAAITWASFYDSTDLVLGDAHYTYDGIIIMPPPDTTYYVSILGLFYSPTLTATMGAALTSGTITLGTSYVIADWLTDDNFTNVGGANVDGTIFTATGTTPTHWSHSSILKPITQTKSFWSENHPDLLIQAALYKLETFYRNSEGAKDWESDIVKAISKMDIDAAHGESADVNQMQG